MKLTPEFAFTLGALKGDGWVKSYKYRTYIVNRICVASKDKEFLKVLKSNFKSLFNKKVRIIPRRGYFFIEFNSKLAVQSINSFDLNRLLKASDEVKGMFLRGFFDAEGCVTFGKVPKGYRRAIDISNKNLKLLKLCDLLLNSLGIKTRRIYVKRFDFYRLNLITDKQNFIVFRKKIGFTIKRKQKRLAKIINTYKDIAKYSEVDRQKVYRLRQLGLSVQEIHKRTNIKQNTIHDWIFHKSNIRIGNKNNKHHQSKNWQTFLKGLNNNL